MKRKSILVVIHGDDVEAWGNLRKLCDAHGFKYWTLSKKQFPIIHDGVTIHKVPYNEKDNEKSNR